MRRFRRLRRSPARHADPLSEVGRLRAEVAALKLDAGTAWDEALRLTNDLTMTLQRLEQVMDEGVVRIRDLEDGAAREHGRIMRLLQAIHDDENMSRRGVAQMRDDESYELAFTEPDPLVTVIVPTYRNFA